jgi:hypothetical protein
MKMERDPARDTPANRDGNAVGQLRVRHQRGAEDQLVGLTRKDEAGTQGILEEAKDTMRSSTMRFGSHNIETKTNH